MTPYLRFAVKGIYLSSWYLSDFIDKILDR